jgi:hypothetical protein
VVSPDKKRAEPADAREVGGSGAPDYKAGRSVKPHSRTVPHRGEERFAPQYKKALGVRRQPLSTAAATPVPP